MTPEATMAIYWTLVSAIPLDRFAARPSGSACTHRSTLKISKAPRACLRRPTSERELHQVRDWVAVGISRAWWKPIEGCVAPIHDSHRATIADYTTLIVTSMSPRVAFE